MHSGMGAGRAGVNCRWGPESRERLGCGGIFPGAPADTEAPPFHAYRMRQSIRRPCTVQSSRAYRSNTSQVAYSMSSRSSGTMEVKRERFKLEFQISYCTARSCRRGRPCSTVQCGKCWPSGETRCGSANHEASELRIANPIGSHWQGWGAGPRARRGSVARTPKLANGESRN